MLPLLRTDISLVPVRHQGKELLVVSDPVGLCQQAVSFGPQMVPILQLFDGRHSVRDLQVVMMRLGGGRLVREDEARALVDQLDRLLLLQTERYRAALEDAKAAFCQSTQRPVAHAGTAYPQDQEALRAWVSSTVDPHPQVPGHPRALVAPHIDPGVGRQTYGKVYAQLKDRSYDRVILLGTGHSLSEGLFSITTKAYETPLGPLRSDPAVVELLRCVPGVLASDDFSHRREHSLEFQVVFLRSLLGPSTTLVPILCGAVDDWLPRVPQFREIPGVGEFLDCLKSLVDDHTLVVAGVDLSHVGPKFGDSGPATVWEAEFRAHDRALLDAVCCGDPLGFWREAQRVQNRFNVCGLSALACVVYLVPGAKGTVVDYQVWHEHATRSAVSFAGVIFTD